MKLPKVMEARKQLFQYFKDNKLDPEEKDWSKDPKHGKNISNLLFKLNKERDKLLYDYPKNDYKNNVKLTKMEHQHKLKKKAAEAAKAAKKAAEVKESKKDTKKVEKEDKPAKKVHLKYDYPLVDGREMNSDEKKKYRQEQRKAKNGTPKKESKKDVKKDTKKDVKKSKTPVKEIKIPKDIKHKGTKILKHHHHHHKEED
jgi:hypothetical protein